MTQIVNREIFCDVKNCRKSDTRPNADEPPGGWGQLHLKVWGDRDLVKDVCPEHSKKILEMFLE